MDHVPTPENFSIFGSKFQESLVNLIIRDKTFTDQISEVLDYSFFEYKPLVVITEKVIKYRNKYKDHPTFETLKSILKSELESKNQTLNNEIWETFEKLKEEKKIDNAYYIKEKSLDFCKKQVLKKAIIKSIDLIPKSSFDEISVLINDALKMGLDPKLGYDFIEDFEERFKIKLRCPISTGWEVIDRITKNGLGKGEMGVIVAPTGAGKSMFMVHLGAEALKKGRNVIYYTLELADTHIGNRFDSCITGISLNELHTCKEAIFETIKQIEGKLLIKEYPTKSVTTVTIANHLDRLSQKGFKPDMIIIDYADLLKPVSTYKDKRFEIESIYEELRSIGQKYESNLWTCSQTNRSGLNAEVVTMESISEAFNKCFVADFIGSLSRTIDDKNANSGRFFVAKNRFGTDGLVFPIFMDPSRVEIKVLDPREEKNVEEFIKPEDKVKNTYKKFAGLNIK